MHKVEQIEQSSDKQDTNRRACYEFDHFLIILWP